MPALEAAGEAVQDRVPVLEAQVDAVCVGDSVGDCEDEALRLPDGERV